MPDWMDDRRDRSERSELPDILDVELRSDRLRVDDVGRQEVVKKSGVIPTKNVGDWEVKVDRGLLSALWDVVIRAPALVGAAIKIIQGVLMKDWKTTVVGAVGFLTMVAKWLGVDVPADVSDGVIAICLFVGLHLAKDKGI